MRADPARQTTHADAKRSHPVVAIYRHNGASSGKYGLRRWNGIISLPAGFRSSRAVVASSVLSLASGTYTRHGIRARITIRAGWPVAGRLVAAPRFGRGA